MFLATSWSDLIASITVGNMEGIVMTAIEPECFNCRANSSLKNKIRIIDFIIRLGLNVTLTHQYRSYRDSETKGNVEEQKRKHSPWSLIAIDIRPQR